MQQLDLSTVPRIFHANHKKVRNFKCKIQYTAVIRLNVCYFRVCRTFELGWNCAWICRRLKRGFKGSQCCAKAFNQKRILQL
eukprot:UN01698